MAKIKERGRLIAGVDQNTYLFGFRNPATNNLEGFDIDMVRQVAKALFGDENKVQYKVITSKDREDALARGDVDIVVRTYTVNCDRLQKIAFSSVYYATGSVSLVGQDLAGQGHAGPGGQAGLRDGGIHLVDPDRQQPGQAGGHLGGQLVGLPRAVAAGAGRRGVHRRADPGRDGRAGPNLKMIGPKLTDEPYGIGIPKANTEMVRFVNAVLEKIRATARGSAATTSGWAAARARRRGRQP